MESKDRLIAVLDFSKMNAHAFAHHIGVPYQKVIDVKRGQIKKISAILANGIVNKYPNIDINWLITGEGSMFKTAPKVSGTVNNIDGETSEELVEKLNSNKERKTKAVVQSECVTSSLDVNKLIEEISALRKALIEERQTNVATINRLVGVIEMLGKR